MDIFNTTPYVFFPFDTSLAPTLPSASLIVRGTFALQRDQPAVAKPKDAQKPPRGDETYLDDLGRSLAYSTDLVPTKVRGEVLVYGTCRSYDDHPRPSQDVSIQVGPIQKTLRVSGPRVFVEDTPHHWSPGRTAPFTMMPIRWELAFGGLAFSQNPLGSGIDEVPDEQERLYRHLPCIEYPDSRMQRLDDRPVPAGLGPIAPSWMPRSKLQGTMDERWAAFRAPLPPKDFDPSFYNSAPADQQLKKGYFRGDEAVVMSGLHKGMQRYTTALPGKRIRVFTLLDGAKTEADAPSFVEVPMNLDTVHIDSDKNEMVLVWRGPITVANCGVGDVLATYIAEEDVASEPLSLDAHHARFLALQEPVEPPPAPDAVVAPTEAENARRAKIDAEIEAQLTGIKKMLTDAKVDPKVVAEVNQTKDPVKMFELLERHTWEKIRELEAMTATAKGT